METSWQETKNKNGRPKIIRVTTSDISLDLLLKGQLGYVNQTFDVVGLSADSGFLSGVAQREGIRVEKVPFKREISLADDWRCLLRLIKIFKNERPYIVHTNTPKGSLLSMVAAKVAHVPHRIYTVTGLRYQGARGLLRLILKSMERITCLCANKVIPEGEGVRKTLLQEHIARKVSPVLHYGNINGVDTAWFSKDAVQQSRAEMRSELGLGATDFVFVYVGRIVRDKGMTELAASMRRIKETKKNVRLIMVGDFEPTLDSLRPEDEQFLRLDGSVCYVGFQKDIRPYLKAADAFVFPSYREGFPNTVLQAGAMELPSIVTDICGCNEIIENGKNGLVIAPRDADALCNAMLKLAEEPQTVMSLSRNARHNIEQKYEQRDVWRAVLRMYKSLERK